MSDMEKIPYIVYEGSQARSERIIKRLIIALIIVTALLFVSNVVWLYAWTQYDYVGEDSDIILHSDGEGDASYIGNDGDIVNGDNYNP